MSRLTERQIDDLFREALNERAQALLPVAHGEAEMAERLERTLARRRTRRQLAFALLAAALLIGLTLAVAVGSGLLKLPLLAVATPEATRSLAATVPPTPTIVATVPTDELTEPGTLLLCDDLSRPPLAFSDAQGNPSGVDIDMFAAIAQRLGLQAQVVDARFTNDDSMHQASNDGTCDVVAGDTYSRYTLGFVHVGEKTIPYLGEGSAYVVRTGDAGTFDTPVNVRSSFLCGKTIAEVATGTTTFDQGTQDNCQFTGHPLTVKMFSTNDDAIRALESGDVMAYYADLLVAGPDVAQHPDQLELAHPEGLGFDVFASLSVAAEKPAMLNALEAAMNAVVGDGTYDRILRRWSLPLSAICPEDMQPDVQPKQACLIPAPPSATPAPSGGALTVSSWRQVGPDATATLGEPYGLGSSGSVFIVAGGSGGTPGHRNVQFWTSPDGQTWSLSPAASTGYPQGFAFDGNAGVAVGSDGNQAAIWTSPDSRTWTRPPNPPALTPSGQETGMQLWHVAHGPAGYVAIGELSVQPNPHDTIGQALIVWSPDGRDWQRVPMGPFADTEFTNLHDVVVVGDRYVIAGDREGSPDAPGPTLWTSTDGRTWTTEPALADGPSSFIELVAGPQGALLAGISPGALRSTQSCLLWGSSDGLAWTPRGNCTEGLDSPGLVATPFGFAATVQLLGTNCDGSPCPTPTQFPCAGGVEVSVTGVQWTCLPPPPSAPLPPASIVAASQNEIVAVNGGIWVADVTVNP